MRQNIYDTQLFSELYDVHPQAIVWLYPIWNETNSAVIDFEYAYSNEEGLRYLNLNHEQFRGLRVSTSVTLTPELRRKVFEEMLTIYETGQKSESFVFNPALNKYARVLRTKLRGGILSVVEDVTKEQRNIQQLEQQTLQLQEQTRQLEEQKNLLDNILKNSSNGISVSQVFRDKNGKVIDALTILANDAAVKHIGYPREIYLTKRATEIEPAVMDSPYYQMCIKTLETGEPFVMQYYMESTSRWLELTVSKLDYNHLIQIFTDVTPIKEAQLKLEKTVDSLKRSNAQLEDFAHAASHDLKEPIRKIHFFADRLRNELKNHLNENQNRLFERLEYASRRMGILVDDLLSYSQATKGAIQLEEVDLNKKVRLVLEDIELEVQTKNAEVKVDHLPTVKGNRRQLQQLFHNLISNALKYSKPEMSPIVHITARTVTGKDVKPDLLMDLGNKLYHFIEVSDNGIGFDQQDSERIFNVFTRLHSNAEYRGTGVGLSIVQKVVENHNGFVWAESEVGKGASFKVLLPIEQ